MSAVKDVVEALGGKATMEPVPITPVQLHEAIRQGFRSSVIRQLLRHDVLRPVELKLFMSERTLARRVRGGRLTPDESDRIARTTRLVLQARETFADDARADAWLRSANRALGGGVPLEMTRHDAGARLVEALLDRIAYGDHT